MNNNLYNTSPKNKNTKHIIINLKQNNNKYINPTRNHEYNLNAINENTKLSDSNNNKTISKRTDNKKNLYIY